MKTTQQSKIEVSIERPICETRFPTSDGPDRQLIICPCGRTLEISTCAAPASRAIPAAGQKKKPCQLAQWQLRRVTEYMQAKIDSPLRTAELAAISRLSYSHFCRAFKGSTGLSPYRWHLKSRVERACVLLTETDLSVAEVAYNMGFSDQSHFTRTFTKIVGASPGTWRRAQTSHPLGAR